MSALARWFWVTVIMTPVLAATVSLYAQEIPVESVARDWRTLVELGDRLHGSQGNLRAAEFIAQRLTRLGYEVSSDDVTLPMPVDHGSSLIGVEGFTCGEIQLHALWPNLVRTSMLPRKGVSGPLVYIGGGTYQEMDGKPIGPLPEIARTESEPGPEVGSICLMDVDSGNQFVTARSMGAQAIVFVEPPEIEHSQMEDKFLRTPLDIPRFWIKAADAEKVVRAALSKCGLDVSSPARLEAELTGRGLTVRGTRTVDKLLALYGDVCKRTQVQVNVKCRMTWERRTGKNLYAILYGTDPLLRKEAVVIQAYYDSMSVVPTLAPGAEQAGGMVGLLELARALKAQPPRRTVVLLATTAHCEALAGMGQWMIMHGPRGGTDANPPPEPDQTDLSQGIEWAAGQTPVKKGLGQSLKHGLEACWDGFEGGVEWVVKRVAGHLALWSLLATAAALGGVVIASVLTHRWRAMGESDPEATRRADGMSSLRFVLGLLLLPLGVTTMLLLLTQEFRFSPEDPIDFKHGAKIRFVISLDLTGGSRKVGIFHAATPTFDSTWDKTSHRSYMAQYVVRLQGYAERAGVTAGTGVTFIDGVDAKGRDFRDLVPGGLSVDGAMALKTGNPALTFYTIDDVRLRVDTPLDNVMSRANVENLAAQVGALRVALSEALNHGEGIQTGFLAQTTAQVIRDLNKRLETRVVEANFRESFVADSPLADALVVYPAPRWLGNNMANQNTLNGVRWAKYQMTDATGTAVDNFVQGSGRTLLSAHGVDVRPYKLDPEDGRIIYAADRGEQGAVSYPLRPTFRGVKKKHQVVVFRCEALDIFDMDNPRYLRAATSGGTTWPVIFDGDDARPQEYGWELIEWQSPRDPGRENVGVLFVKASRAGTRRNRVKVMVGSTLFGLQYLLTNSTRANLKGEVLPQGVGFSTDETDAVFYSALHSAQDMTTIDGWRIDKFKEHGIRNERLVNLHETAVSKLAQAKEALRERAYTRYRAALDESLGFEARAYPDVKGTTLDTVRGFIFYCALLLPFAFFAERLFFGFADIRRQVAGFAGFFVVIFGLMALVHPLFRITNVPIVIFLAFVILVLSVTVLAIVIGKFNEQMAEMKRKAAKVHEADVGRLSASGAAIMLGISNMKKRKVRTTLTTVTLVLLTFTVMSFTSVRQDTYFSAVPQLHKPPYEGLLIRDRAWLVLEQITLDNLKRSFDAHGTVIPRAWYSSTDPSRQNFKFTVDTVDRSAEIMGIMGMTPDEEKALDLGRTGVLKTGRWFRPGERDVCILTSRVYLDLLKLKLEDVDKPRTVVRSLGRDLRVIGVLDSGAFSQVHDLDDESPTPLDLSIGLQEFDQALTAGMYQQHTVQLAKLGHLATDTVFLAPYETCMAMGGRIQSVAVTFPEGTDYETLLIGREETRVDGSTERVGGFLRRVGMLVFLGRDGRVVAYSSIGLQSLKGMSNLVVPIALAALIVLNTMMGAVHERTREIGIYSSVGLAPQHISALFLAESCVYAVVGAVSGYLLGMMVGKVVDSFALLPGLTLNYSSLSAVYSTLAVMATVLLSTLYPAALAASSAVPDVTRRWKFPEPKGDRWEFEFPFTVASDGVLGLFVFLDNYFDANREASIGSFYADHVKLTEVEDEHGKGHVLQMDVWLAPFDLAVSQTVQLRALPTEDEGITRIEMCITRLSGEEGSWKRLNRGFLGLLRKQFLIWRTVPASVKEEYNSQGLRLLASTKEGTNVAG